ncbi:sulfatase family protein [Pontiella sulfatireligans]|uniref:Arylsulfatase n=1 Tax=Pontiella sulfatireligans TaxID=2750658 RepID=A0A6C2UMS3_9BACT|nr:sulfatase [Pontiella sulfatireligans]SPS74404.1 sulfatase S1_8 [Kiritimatiellales bacterium]VGO20396.1 Arylsulfatase [Pontiella sulfatireligans]
MVKILMVVWVLVFPLMLQAVAKKPNILFCLADDWGWPHAGAYGDTTVRTPVFDRLAKEGVVFDHAYVSSPSCTPCRSSILTGQQFYRLGTAANLRGGLDVNHPNFMFMLRDAGYDIGHWRKAWDPGNYDEGGYTEHPCGPESSFDKFMNGRDEGKPFCFWFGTSDPHRKYDPGTGVASGIKLADVHVPGFFPDTEAVRSDIADYYFEVERWDTDVGVALKLLEERGEMGNTIVVMTGDHGMPFPRCKGNMYDWGLRVPLAVRWNAIDAGRRVNGFVSLTDLAPTFLEAAGVNVPSVMTGQSLLPLLQGDMDAHQTRDYVVAGRERHTPAQGKPSLDGYPSRAIRTGRWLLVLNLEPSRLPAGALGWFGDCDGSPTKNEVKKLKGSMFYDLCFSQRPEVELYDCQKDPDQLNNLASNPEYKETVAQLRRQLAGYLKQTDDPRFTDEEVLFDTFPYNKKKK